MTLLEAVHATRRLLDDFGGDREVPWALDDSACDTDNAEIVRLLDEGRDEACTRRPRVDAQTASVTQATVGTDGLIGLPERVLYISRVRLDDTDQTLLAYASQQELDRLYPGWLTAEGEPRWWTYWDARTALLVPQPIVATEVRWRAHRLPLVPLDWASRDDEIAEMPSEACVRTLPYWAAKCVLEGRRHKNAANLSMKYEAEFDRIAGPRPTEQQLETRRRMTAGPVSVRSLQIAGRL